MKVAISSTGDTVEAPIDSRFGRCSFFALYDTITHQVQFIPNTAADSSQGAGPAAVQLLAVHQVKKVISGEFGTKVQPLLKSLSIEMQSLKNESMTILDIIKQEK